MKQQSSASGSGALGAIGAVVLVVLVLSDLARKLSPTAPASLSTLPLLVALGGCVIALKRPSRPRLPAEAWLACASLLSLCFFGTLVALANGIPTAQITAGWIAEAGPIPGLCLGFALSFEDRGWRVFTRTVYALVLVNMAAALLHELHLTDSGALEMIAGARRDRGISTGERFSYTPALFRTANVFASFLAFSGLAAVIDFSHRRTNSTNHLTGRRVGLLGLLLFGSIFAARRSGLLMLLGSIFPFLFRLGGRLRVAAFVFAAAGVLYYVAIDDEGPIAADMSPKLEFATTELGLKDRLGNAFAVSANDWSLISSSGEGIGSVGLATRAAGPKAFLRDMWRLAEHPVIHVGWFKDLLAYGFLGTGLHAAWFLLLILAVVRAQRLGQDRTIPGRWSGLGYLLVAIVNYYLVATSWLHSLTGGLLFGLAIGLFLGRMRAATRPQGPKRRLRRRL